MSMTPQEASTSPMPAGVTDSNYRPKPGRLGNLTVTQQRTLDKFRKELQDEGYFVPERMDDALLLRFLRARNFDLALAKMMIINAEKWRKDFGVDEIYRNFHFKEKEVVNKYYPQYYHKMDKDGRPLYIERLGMLDINALYSATTHERLLQHLVYEFEKTQRVRFPACSTAVGHPVETCCIIIDFKGISLTSFYGVKDYVCAACAIGQDRYPETLGKCYLIDTPWGFSSLWEMLKPWLDEVTIGKIDILGSDYPQVLAQIPKENLPRDLGGACICEGGCALSGAGPWKFHWNNQEEAFI